MSDFNVMHALGNVGWWVIEGKWDPPKTRVVATFIRLDEALRYAQWRTGTKNGRPTAHLNDGIVYYALRAAGKGGVRRSADILGITRQTLHRYLRLRVEQNAG